MADQGTEGLLSPWLRRKRFNAARRYVKGRVLDVGCGSGSFARFVDCESYVGVDVDQPSLDVARQTLQKYCFLSEFPPHLEKFDSVVSLAVIEHVSRPEEFLRSLKDFMRDEDSRIVITTPHPSVDWLHHAGASIGLFSKHANEEHEELLDWSALKDVGEQAGLRLIHYERFLFGANQLAVFSE